MYGLWHAKESHSSAVVYIVVFEEGGEKKEQKLLYLFKELIWDKDRNTEFGIILSLK